MKSHPMRVREVWGISSYIFIDKCYQWLHDKTVPIPVAIPKAAMPASRSLGRYNYYGFQTVCKCPFWALLVTLVTDSNQTWAN